MDKITNKIYEKYVEYFSVKDYDILSDPDRSVITFKVIEKYINKPWNWGYLSGREDITKKIFFRHIERWNFYNMSLCGNINPDIIEDNLSLPWDFDMLGSSARITPEFIDRHPELPWNWYYISLNKNITAEFIKKHKDKNWYYSSILGNELLMNDTACMNAMKKDIVERRDTIRSIFKNIIEKNLLEGIVNYVGYD